MAFDDTILNELSATVERLRTSINPSIRTSVDQNKNVIKKMQTDEQMFSGINASGNAITPDYAKSTINYKKRKGQPFDRVTLKDSGDFYDSIEIEARTDDFVISTQITYSIYLVSKYAEILGITDKNLQTFINNYTLPIIKQNFNDIIAES
jgi:hypothetical protein